MADSTLAASRGHGNVGAEGRFKISALSSPLSWTLWGNDAPPHLHTTGWTAHLLHRVHESEPVG
jgi:hypothetical protein